jgi:hypothetical protein
VDGHSEATETALARAVADELRHGREFPEELSLPDLVRRCAEAGVNAPDVLRRALDRVTHENNDQPTI